MSNTETSNADAPKDTTMVTKTGGDTIEDMMKELQMTMSVNEMNELLKLQMNGGLKAMDSDSELFKDFFTPQKENIDKDVPFLLRQNENDVKQSSFNGDIESIDNIFTQGDSFQPSKSSDVEVEMVKDAIEQSEPFPGKRDILAKLTGYQQFGPSWVMQEGYKDLSGDNYKYFYVENKDNRRHGDIFEKISVEVLKTILQTKGADAEFSRRMSLVEYDYDYDDDNDDDDDDMGDYY